MILITQVEVKDDQGQQILDAICERYGYTGFAKSESLSPMGVAIDSAKDEPVEQSRQEFVQEFMLKSLFSEYRIHVSASISAAATKQAELDIDTIVKPEVFKKGK